MTSDGGRTGKLNTEGFPHNYLEDAVDFEVTDVSLGGTDAEDRVQVLSGDRRIATASVREWDTIDVGAEVEINEDAFVTLPQEERGEYAPSGVDATDPPLRFVFAVRSSATIRRHRETGDDLGVDPTSTETQSFEITLERSQMAGEVELRPYLVRASGQNTDSGHATDLGDRLASGPAWTLEVDEVDEDGGFLQPLYEEFDRPGYPGDDHLHQLMFQPPSEPKLYLNANHPRLVGVLNNEGTTGADPRFRDVLYDYIEQSVWKQLLFRAASDADAATGELQYDWEEEVVDQFAQNLFDDVDGTEAVVIEMAECVESGDDLDRLAQEIELAVEDHVGHPDAAVSLFQEGLSHD